MDLRYQSLLLWFVGIRVSGPHDSASNTQVPLLRTAQRFVHGVRLINFSGRERGRSSLYYFCCFFRLAKNSVCSETHLIFESESFLAIKGFVLICLIPN